MKRLDGVRAAIAAGTLFPCVATAAIPCAELATGFQAPDVVIASATVVPEVTSGNTAAPERRS